MWIVESFAALINTILKNIIHNKKKLPIELIRTFSNWIVQGTVNGNEFENHFVKPSAHPSQIQPEVDKSSCNFVFNLPQQFFFVDTQLIYSPWKQSYLLLDSKRHY